jgi:hypothetical protein
MSSTEARTTDDGTTGTTQSRDDASSAAERLGGPIEDEQSPDTARRAETEVDRQADTAVSEGDRSAETARRSETEADRQADTAVSEGERSAARSSETDADRQADTAVSEGERSGQRATTVGGMRSKANSSTIRAVRYKARTAWSERSSTSWKSCSAASAPTSNMA